MLFRSSFNQAYTDLSSALDAAEQAIVKAIMGHDQNTTRRTITAEKNNKNMVDARVNANITLAENITKNKINNAMLPNKDDCVQATNSNILQNANITQTAYIATETPKIIGTALPGIAAAKGNDYLMPTEQELADANKAIDAAATPPPISSKVPGQCLANGTVYELIAKKYGFTTGDTTDVSGHATHTGGAVDLNGSNPTMKAGIADIKAGRNTPNAQKVTAALNDMKKLGANNIMYEDFSGTGTYWNWTGSKFVDTTKKMGHGSGNHVHVGNTKFDAQAANPDVNHNAGYTCADLEALTGKTIAEIYAESLADAQAALNADCKIRQCVTTSAKCLGANKSTKCCKCWRVLNTIAYTTAKSREAKLYGLLNLKYTDNTAINSPSTVGTENAKLMNSQLDMAAFTGAVTTKAHDNVRMVRTILSTDVQSLDANLNQESVALNVNGRMGFNNNVHNTLLAILQGSLLTYMASYQMPVTDGGDKALETLVVSLLPADGGTKGQQQAVATMASGLIGAGNTLSLSAQSEIEVMHFTSASYQQGLLNQDRKSVV